MVSPNGQLYATSPRAIVAWLGQRLKFGAKMMNCSLKGASNSGCEQIIVNTIGWGLDRERMFWYNVLEQMS
jgi:hypothetical protein